MVIILLSLCTFRESHIFSRYALGICNENKKAREYLLANMPDIIKFENLDFNKTDDMSVGMSNQLNKILSIGGFD